MNKLFTAFLFFVLYLQVQSMPAGFLHLQSIIDNGGARIMLNDTTVLAAIKTGATSSPGHFARIRLNDLSWEYLGALPDDITSFFAIAMKDSLNGVILGSDGRLFYTEDGGRSFSPSTITFSTPQAQTRVTIFHVPAGGYLAYYTISAQHNLYYSDDGRSFSHVAQLSGFTDPRAVGDTLYYFAGQRIRMSPDGGMTFPSQDYIFNLPQGAVWAYVLTHDVMFCSTQQGNFFRSTDGGVNWVQIALPDPFITINRAIFKDETTGILPLQSSNHFYYTEDAGETWKKAARQEVSRDFWFTEDQLYHFATTGTIYHTADWGETWHKKFEPFPNADINGVSFFGKLGMVAGDNGFVGVSRNGGYHYEIYPQIVNQRLMTAAVINDSIMLTRTFSGTIYRSADRGETWQATGSRLHNSDSYFKHNRKGHIITYGSAPLVSTDYGASFGTAPSAANLVFGDFMPNGDLIAARQESGGLFIRRYGMPGYFLTELATVPSSFQFVDIIMYNNRVGYLLGKEGNEQFVTYKTTNGGSSWSRKSGISTTVDLNRLGLSWQVLDENTIVVAQSNFNQNVASYNKAFVSVDGGDSWQVHELNDPVRSVAFIIRSAYFLDAGHLFAGLRNGNLFLNAFATATTGMQEVETGEEDDDEEQDTTSSRSITNPSHELYVYPNPAAHTLYIKMNMYDADTVNEAVVTMYDITGRDVVRQRISGSDLDAQTGISVGHLPEGLYVVRVQAGGQVYTSKFFRQL